MRSRRKVYWNGLQEGDLTASLCGFDGVKWKYVCFFAWCLELVLSRFEGRWSDSDLPCLLLLHCQVRLKSRWNFLKTKATTPGNNIYTLLLTFIAFTSFISFKFQTLFFPYKLSYYATGGPYYAWATCVFSSLFNALDWFPTHRPCQ